MSLVQQHTFMCDQHDKQEQAEKEEFNENQSKE